MKFFRQSFRRTVCALAALMLLPAACAATRDLGGGLAYFRVTALNDDLPALTEALAANPALVIDMRGVSASVNSAQALRSALAAPASASALATAASRAARFVLINGVTSSSVPFALGAGLPANAAPGVIVIAPAEDGVPADVKAPGSAADDRRACEAIAGGAELLTLIDRQPEKKRYDEAVLSREHAGLPEPETQPETKDAGKNADGAAKDGAKTEASKPGDVLTDSVLQTAVQIYRALAALRKV